MVAALVPTNRPYKRAYGLGLYVLVSPSGSKWWRFKYRFEGRHKTLSCGTFPDVGVEEARHERDALRAVLGQGINPSELRSEERARERAKRKQQAVAAPAVRVVASLDGAIEIWKGNAVVRLTPNEAATTQGLLSRIMG